jgi:oligosaccharide repeat unit polymerase
MELSYYISIILLIAGLFFVSWVSRKIFESWFFPGAFFPLIWSLYMTISFLFAPEFQPNLIGVIMIILGSILVSIGASLFPLKVKSTYKKNKSKIKINFLFLSGILLTFISAIGFVFVLSIGFSWFKLEQNLLNLYILPNFFATERYNEVQSLPNNIKIVMFLTYPASLLSGFTYPLLKGAKRLFSFLPIFITIIYGALFAVRSGVLLSIILTFSGMVCAKIYFQHDLKSWFNKVFIGGISSSLLLFGIYILFQWLRGGPENYFIIDELILSAKAGILGSFSAFTIWFSNYSLSQDLSLGLNTFAAPMEILGLTERASGFYKDFISIGPSVTNIYSAFRGIVSDFGLIGSLIFLGFFGYISAISFYLTSKRNIYAIVPLSIFYTFTLFSPLISIFTFNSIIISFIIFFLVIKLSHAEFE